MTVNLDTSLSPQQIFNNCRTAVAGLRTEALEERKKRLSALRRWVISNREHIQKAAYDDFRKPSMETDATEIFHVLNEIKTALRNLDQWAAPRKVDAPLYLPGTRAWIQYEPRGACLIIAPWNYPFSLAAGPLVSALAAGNSVVIKPSEITPTVSSLIKRMCDEIFDPSIVSVCEGGVAVSQALLSLPFDHIFFTGSPAVGKIVMRAAAENLTSVTLELGGKSPAVICADARLDDAAERVAVGKFMNNGQTCIAPDYVLIDTKVADAFVARVIKITSGMYASNGSFEASADYGRIVNESNFNRVSGLIEDAVSRGAKLEWQGKSDRSARFIHPVIMSNVSPDSKVLEEEIFGPVLPIVRYDHIDDAVRMINSKPKPLALYVFTGKRSTYEKVLKATSSGTVAVNDCSVQFLHHELPFGGVNNSGIGKAHGWAGFLAFSNEKSVLKQRNGFSAVKLFYPPFTVRTKKLMDWFLKLF